MIIKKFTAPTMTEALAKVRDELGTEAIILSTKSSRAGGVFDFVGRSAVEVTAAVDDDRSGGKSGVSRSMRTTASPVGPSEARNYPPANTVAYTPSAGRKAAPAVSDETSMKELSARVNIDAVIEDIRELKNAVKVLSDTALAGELSGLPPRLAQLLNAMNASGYDDRVSKRVIRQLLNDLGGSELGELSLIIDRAVDLLMAGVGDISPVVFAGAKPRIVAFVGPTGTGKTTTIAKLSTDFSLNRGKKVSVLSIDTKRVDAVGQLKAYCRIVDIPLHIAYNPDELPGIMPKLMNCDVVLVDTPGLAPMDKKQMMDMIEFLQRLVPQEVHLTVSVTTSLGEMKRIFENFSILKPNRIIFTKLDETESYGPMISFAIFSKKPVSYVTFGQSVPGDFAVADPESVIRKNLNSKPQ